MRQQVHQQVNLYQLRFQKVRPPLAAGLLARGMLGALGVLLLVFGHAEWRARDAGARLESLHALRASESTRLVELATLYPAREVDAALEGEVAGLELERAAKTRLLGLLSNQGLGNTDGFSAQMSGIARRRVDGLWLRELRIEAGGSELALVGSALDAELVPRFLRNLGQEETFAGRDFRRLHIERSNDEPGRIDWSVHTRPEGADDAGGSS